MCERRCLGRTSDNKGIGVDGRKIKYKETKDEKVLKKRVREFLRVAVVIDRKERDKEERVARERRKRKIKRIIEKIDKDQINQVDIIGSSQYNIKSLI